MRANGLLVAAVAVGAAAAGAGAMAIAGPGGPAAPATGSVSVDLQHVSDNHGRAGMAAKPKGKRAVRIGYFTGGGTVDTAQTGQSIDVRLAVEPASRCPRVIDGGVVAADPGVVQLGSATGPEANEYHVYLGAADAGPTFQFRSHLTCIKGTR